MTALPAACCLPQAAQAVLCIGSQANQVTLSFAGVNKSVLREILNHRLCVVCTLPHCCFPGTVCAWRQAAAGCSCSERCAQVHPNIVQFREIFLTPVHLAIVMEYAAGGDMFEYVIKHKLPAHGQGLLEHSARTFFQQLIVALEFCHELGIANRCASLGMVTPGQSPSLACHAENRAATRESCHAAACACKRTSTHCSDAA